MRKKNYPIPFMELNQISYYEHNELFTSHPRPDVLVCCNNNVNFVLGIAL